MALIKITSFAKAKQNNGSVGGSISTTKGFTTTIKKELDTHYLWGQPFNGTQDVNGDMNVNGNIDVEGNINVEGYFDVSKNIHTKSDIHVNGNIDLEGDMNVEGYLNVTKNINTKADMHVEGYVYSNNIDTGTIQANNGSITTVNSTNTNTTNINATNGDIETLITQNAEIQNLNVDVLNAKQAHFWELVIDKMRSTNGTFILSPANAKIEKVVEDTTNGNYQLMWRATDINTNKAITNDFEVNDQIICMSFNQASVDNNYDLNNKYYWAKVTSKGTISAYDDLRETMCDWHYITVGGTQVTWDGTLNPEVGDEICVLGNTTDTARQNAIILSSVNNTFLDEDLEAPSIAQYKGIKTFELKPYRLNCLSGNENTFYGNFNVIVGNTTSDVKDLINDSKSNIASIQTDSLVTFIMADSNGKIDSINAATGLVKKIEVYLGNDLIPTSEYDTSCYVQWRDAKFYPISATGNKLRDGIDINGFTVNTNDIAVNWTYHISEEETTQETTPTDTEFVTYIKFTHNGTTYEKMFTVPATVIKTEKGTDAELDKLVVDSFKAVVTIKDKLEISGTAYILHVKGNTTTRVADLSEYTLDCVSDAGDKFNFNKSNYFYYINDNYISNYSTQSKTQKIYTVRLFKGLNKVDEQTFNVTFDSGAIFQIKADAITSAVQSSKTYTDGEITTVSNNVSRIEQTANQISSRVTAIENDYATNTEFTQTANEISSRVTTIENDYVTSSELTQTANNVQINIYDELNNKTGIDVKNGQITLDADNTTIIGNLNITDTDNGLTVYDNDGVPRINLQPKKITDFTDDIEDTILSHIYTYNNANPTAWNATSDSYSLSLTKGDTLELRRITATMYARNTASTVYPSGGESGLMYGTLTVTKPDNSTKTFNLVMQGKGNGRFQQTKETLIADLDGTYKFVFNVFTNDTFQTTYKYLYCTFSCSFEIAQVRQTYLGTDGLFAHTGASKQVVFNEDETLLQFGANGIRWTEKIVNGNAITGNRAMDVAVGYNNTNPTSVTWIPFYNYTPIFNPSNWIKGSIINTGNTNKYYYKIDVQNDRGMCVVNYPPTDTSGRVQDAWILLPSQVIDDGNGNVGYYLPIGYTVTIINHTFLSALKCNLYVTGDAAQKNEVVIIDSDRNYNYYCDLSGTQSSDTYIYMGHYTNSSTGINTMFWQALHNTQ